MFDFTCYHGLRQGPQLPMERGDFMIIVVVIVVVVVVVITPKLNVLVDCL